MQSQGMREIQKRAFLLFAELGEKSRTEKVLSVIKKEDNSITIRINDAELTNKIIDAYLDKDNRVILYNLRTPMTITEIVKRSKLPQSSVYRKVDALVEQGLILFSGFDRDVKNGKGNHKGAVYEKTIHSISFNLKSDTHTTEITIEKHALQKCKPLYLLVSNTC
ncbi:helix-turn-helix domain-containing protein [Candidatus Nitrosotenuis chungbukensis]|uniref:helix-turn-helix domain-containing protein n=1 Tax=Candidatus Nitrosotenuis chungbukensis TaxID=1353246 RepID=UPI0005B284B8|nr:helix-turn-helix domain-containing protein [Candidatus Nitrosotenuis chungbukensis]WKT57226.1 helix-turn-helix domain-containing protein [Candidatus Nitrosotenuis chungbukensis]